MTHKTIKEYYPRNRSLVGRFIEIDDDCGPIEEEEEEYYFHVIKDDEIPMVYYGTDKNFHHVIFCYKPVVAYIAFSDSDSFYPAVRDDNGESFELFNPWPDNPGEIERDEIIVAKSRVFEDFVEAAKEFLIERYYIDEEKIFTTWLEMKDFINGKKSE